MFKPLLCVRRLRIAMSERSRRRDGDPRGNQRPPEPRGPPPGTGTPSGMGLTPCAKGAAAPVVAPRYSARPSHPSAEEPDRRGRSRSRHRRRRHHREHGDGRDAGDERRGEEKKKKPKSTSAPSAPPPKGPCSSSSSDSEDEEEVPEESKALVVKGAASSENPAAAVPKWLQGRVDDLTSKAVSFSRALVRAQQALKTSARIAREAAQSFEAEYENFTLAQREIDREFQIGRPN